MQNKVKVLLDPHFRSLDLIFSRHDLGRLHDISNVVWGNDEPCPAEELNAHRDGIEIIVTGRWRHGGVEEYPRLRAIMEVGGKHWSSDTIDYRYCFSNGIYVLSCAPAFAPMVAEMALGLAISAGRNISAMDRGFRSGSEQYQMSGNVGATTLFGRKIGLIGYGNLAQSLTPLLSPFTHDIRAYDPWLPDSFLERNDVKPLPLAELLKTSDVIFVLAIPTSENRGMLTRELLGIVKEGSIFVLMSRAHVVDFDALIEFADAGRFRFATDVYPKEPVPADHPVRKLVNATLTPHIAGSVKDDIRHIGRDVVDDIEAITRGISPRAMQHARFENVARL